MAAKKKTIDKFSMPQMFYTGTIEQLSQDGFICTEEGEWEWTNKFFSPYGRERKFREYIYIHGAARIMEISVNEIDPDTDEMLDTMDSGCYAMTPTLFAEIVKLVPKTIISSITGMHPGFSQED